jgi:lipoyl-dependent peroxiredoxin
MSANDVLYQTAARATGGRDGRSATLDGTFEVSLTTPNELGGPGGDGASPEKLFAAGYAACFLDAMKFVASQGGPKIPSDATVRSASDRGRRGASA